MLHTEHEFTLPIGYLDADGTLHRDGVMRLATAADEILPLKDPRVVKNPAYLIVILLSRVVTRLGTCVADHAEGDRGPVREGPRLPAGPLQRHQPAGRTPRGCDLPALPARVPHGGSGGRGGVLGYPLEQLHREVAFIAYHLHWPRGDVMTLEHGERRRWVEEISDINRRMNGEA